MLVFLVIFAAALLCAAVAGIVALLPSEPRRRVSREPANRMQIDDPFAGAERCAACGSWQARHLVRAECWRCHQPLTRTVEAGDP